MTFVIGVDLGGTKTAAGVVDAAGQLLFREQIPTLNRAGGAAILDATAALVERLRDRALADGVRASAVGMGSAGVIDADRGTVISATDAILDWAGTEIRDGLEQRTGLPVRVVNDVHAHALGEAWLGAFKTALVLMGVIKTNVMSAPMLSLDEEETTAVKVILERNGLL